MDDLLATLLDAEPKRRGTVKAALAHAWLTATSSTLRSGRASLKAASTPPDSRAHFVIPAPRRTLGRGYHAEVVLGVRVRAADACTPSVTTPMPRQSSSLSSSLSSVPWPAWPTDSPVLRASSPSTSSSSSSPGGYLKRGLSCEGSSASGLPRVPSDGRDGVGSGGEQVALKVQLRGGDRCRERRVLRSLPAHPNVSPLRLPTVAGVRDRRARRVISSCDVSWHVFGVRGCDVVFSGLVRCACVRPTVPGRAHAVRVSPPRPVWL